MSICFCVSFLWPSSIWHKIIEFFPLSDSHKFLLEENSRAKKRSCERSTCRLKWLFYPWPGESFSLLPLKSSHESRLVRLSFFAFVYSSYIIIITYYYVLLFFSLIPSLVQEQRRRGWSSLLLSTWCHPNVWTVFWFNSGPLGQTLQTGKHTVFHTALVLSLSLEYMGNVVLEKCSSTAHVTSLC